MTASIRKWGNSQGIRLPKMLLDALNWSENEKINIRLEENRIIIEQAERKMRPTIDELFEGYNEEYQPEKIDWGRTEGKEIW